jgi:CPA2 family monovalent cation:H+ antiporter-2
VVAEVIEGSLMLATQTMMQLGVPLNRVLRRLRDARQERYQSTRGYFPGATDEEHHDDPPRLRTLALGGDAASVGKTLSSLHLEALGARVNAIRRPGDGALTPSGETRLREGDVIVLLGTQESLAKAEIRLLQG